MLLGNLLEDVGLDDRRREAIYENAVLRELLAEALGEPDHAGLGGAVGAGVGVAFLAGDGGGVDDAAVTAFAQVRHDGTAANEN